MRIYLIRHGETEWNRAKKIQGQADIPLNETGRQEAFEAAGFFENIDFDAAFSSPLVRAKETAEIILEGRNCPIYLDERLKEISYGVREGQYLPYIHKCPFTRLHSYFVKPQCYIPPKGGETIRELKNRCRLFLEEEIVGKEGQYDNVLVAAHGALIRAMISIVTDLPDADFWKGKKQKNCAITIVQYENRKMIVEEEAI